MFESLIPFPTLITAFSTKDETYETSIKKAGLTDNTPIRMNQTHSSTTHYIKEKPTTPLIINNTDALITSLNTIVLTVKTADCLPILIYHPTGIIGAIHAGRKGTEKAIFMQCLKQIQTTFNISENLHIWFGPAICASCYEIDPIKKQHFNLINENIRQLNTVFKPHTYTLYNKSQCTLENESMFYSYRRDKTPLRHYAHIALM